MKKLITILTLWTIGWPLLGQNIDSLGLDNNSVLNKHESTYLNNSLTKERGDFNFENKRVLFFTGKSATTHELWSKVDYFKSVKNTIRNSYAMDNQLLILNQDEKTASGGFDAFIISWSKVLVTDGFKNRLIAKIKKP